MSDPLAALVAATWERNRERVQARVEHVVAALEDLAAGRAPDAEAAGEAHKLAGGLGTYGKPGSELLRRAELLLTARVAEDAAALADEVRALGRELG